MKTKTQLLLCILISLGMVLSACSNDSSQASSSASASNNSSQGGTALSQVNMLLVGTLKLEDTSRAVTKDEAAQILPLWQAYRSLSSSQTAAEAEVEALLQQIESSMTSEQVQAIKALNLTSTDMMDLMQSIGGGMGPRGTPNPQATPGFEFPSGGFQSGNPPDMPSGGSSSGSSGGTTRNAPPEGGSGPMIIQGGPGMGGDIGSTTDMGTGQMLQGTPDPPMQATAQARFSNQANQVNTILLDVLITKLEAKTTG